MTRDDLYALPPGLPVPVDDGAARHLVGRSLPPVTLASTAGPPVRLDALGPGWSVLYCYPRTGRPEAGPPPGWDEIPGARGCTPQACRYREHYAELRALEAQVYGVSTQTTDYQQEMAARLHLPYPVLSDADFRLTDALGLPTFEVEGMRLLRRLTLLVHAGRIEHCLYPVFPPDADADHVLEWLRARDPRFTVRVRQATLADAARLAALSAELGYPASAEALAQRLGDLLGREDQTVLVAEVLPGEVVGWVHGAEQELLESGRRCELLGLVVDARVRSRGVGRRLVTAVEAWAVARGLEHMAVRSNVTRSESHPFYERLGYARVKTQHAYRKRLGPSA